MWNACRYEFYMNIFLDKTNKSVLLYKNLQEAFKCDER